MRKSVLFLLVALTLPLCAQAEDKVVPSITVRGEAVTKLPPDQVTLPVTVHEENLSLKAAKEKHDDKLRRLLKLAADSGIAKDDIRTSYTSTQPQYDYVQNSTVPRLRGYSVQTSIDFTLHNTALLGEFINKVIELGINETGNATYSLSNEKQVEIDTLVKAVANAYEKASRIAAEAKVSVDKPITISESNAHVYQPVRPMMMMAAKAEMAGGAPEMPAGLTEVRQDVTITYQLK